eukprot:4031036-Pyramimonas_sp.AAC.1
MVSSLDPEDILGDVHDELRGARWPQDVGPQVLRERQRVVSRPQGPPLGRLELHYHPSSP